VWPILRLIRDVDCVLREDPAARPRVFEFHPEIAWRKLAKGRLFSKGSALGALQRLDLLDELNPGWRSALPELLGDTQIGLDDLLDATVGLNVAQRITDGVACRLPDTIPAPTDECGLPMNIWY
jgi:predicted RNase H-like nuclease